MKIEAQYRVHTAAPAPVAVEVELDGEKQPATVTALVIELVPADGSRHGPVKLVSLGGPSDQHAAIAAAFKPGAVVTASFEVAPPAA